MYYAYMYNQSYIDGNILDEMFGRKLMSGGSVQECPETMVTH